MFTYEDVDRVLMLDCRCSVHTRSWFLLAVVIVIAEYLLTRN